MMGRLHVGQLRPVTKAEGWHAHKHTYADVLYTGQIGRWPFASKHLLAFLCPLWSLMTSQPPCPALTPAITDSFCLPHMYAQTQPECGLTWELQETEQGGQVTVSQMEKSCSSASVKGDTALSSLQLCCQMCQNLCRGTPLLGYSVLFLFF